MYKLAQIALVVVLVAAAQAAYYNTMPFMGLGMGYGMGFGMPLLGKSYLASPLMGTYGLGGLGMLGMKGYGMGLGLGALGGYGMLGGGLWG
nr:hypothetical protein BaRGS_011241 [Batillaria attramentaria]